MNQVVKSNEVTKVCNSALVFGLISGAQGSASCHRKFVKPDLVSDWSLTEGKAGRLSNSYKFLDRQFIHLLPWCLRRHRRRN